MTEAKARIGINGFGRIGRLALRAILSNSYPDLEIVAINSRTSDPETIRHMFMYDSTYGVFNQKVSVSEDSLETKNSSIALLAHSAPDLIPWKNYGVDIVLECSGKFTDRESA